MKKLLVVIAVIYSSVTVFSQAQLDPRLKGLDTFVNKVLKDWNAPGVSIAVVEKNKVIFTGGFGYRDVEKKLPVTENTLYAIGSCTKAFTAAIIGMLAKEGKVDMDKPVRNYLPELKFKNEYANDHVTLKDMMSHRTGLPRHDMSWYGSSASRKELIERIQYLEPTAELRERYQYNNFMFLAQGVVIEKVTGKSWEDNMRERIFIPLGMTTSNFSVKDMASSSDASLAYAMVKDTVLKVIPYRNIDAIGPAGSVNSTAKDMAKWLITWINDGRYNGTVIVPSTYRHQAITLQMVTGGGMPGPENPDVHFTGYGFGWGMSSYRGHYRVEHGGGIDGFISTTSFFPSDSIGIFVVSNQGQPVSVIRNFIADRMLKLPYRNWNAQQLNATRSARASARAVVKNDSLIHKYNTKPSHDLNSYAGYFTNPGYGFIEVNVNGDNLTATYNNLGLKLKHYHFDQFEAVPQDPALEGGEPLRVTFNTDSRGNISHLTVPFQPGVDEIKFSRESKTLMVKNMDLVKYTGEYDFMGAVVKVSVKGEKTLVMNVPDQPEYELVPISKHEFQLKGMDGYSVKFDVNDRNEVTTMHSIQPNGTFKAEKKKTL